MSKRWNLGFLFDLRSYCVLVLISAVACSPVEDPGLLPEFSADTAKPIPFKPTTEYNAQRNLYWGDLHIHTSFSTDAYTMGVRATPDDAYRFTRGGEIEHAGGYGIQLSRPLDFAAVTDHSEYLGVLLATKPELPLSVRSYKQRLREDGPLLNTITFLRSTMNFKLDFEDDGSGMGAVHTQQAWQETIAAAERYNDPNRFTTFVAYEWSSMPEQRNLHRNVIYRGVNVPETPYSSLNAHDPRDLWRELESQRKQGMDNFAIPHNGNVSDGKMYDSQTYDGGAMDAAYAERRMRNEPISEIFQVKGSSETHPVLSPQDEFAGFEIYDTKLSKDFSYSQPKGSYIRDALRLGLEMSHSEGFNPYRFGVIGSSDGHNASSPVEEDRYHGKLPLLDGSAGVRMRVSLFMPEESPGGIRWSAAGLAAVWAEENTRASLFDAMRRKETYATSGPRISVRFFGSWGFSKSLLEQSDWVSDARKLGVPMGGVLTSPPANEPPSFAIFALKDPAGANLDRIQIIKAWIGPDGKSQESIVNVAWSQPDQRILNNDGHLASVGNTVDVADASYRNTIGSAQLAAVWTDPHFLPTQEAFYYARVIEIPTPRWTTFDAKALGLEATDPSYLRERAVTSAIWYRPE